MSEDKHTLPKTFAGTRLPAIDAMRGIVMVLMAMDHASHVFNAGRYVRDSFIWYRAGSEIPAAQFLTRWVTHLCAPTFLFLAGLVLALSVSGLLLQHQYHRNGVSHRIICRLFCPGSQVA